MFPLSQSNIISRSLKEYSPCLALTYKAELLILWCIFTDLLCNGISWGSRHISLMPGTAEILYIQPFPPPHWSTDQPRRGNLCLDAGGEKVSVSSLLWQGHFIYIEWKKLLCSVELEKANNHAPRVSSDRGMRFFGVVLGQGYASSTARSVIFHGVKLWDEKTVDCGGLHVAFSADDVALFCS